MIKYTAPYRVAPARFRTVIPSVCIRWHCANEEVSLSVYFFMDLFTAVWTLLSFN